MHWFPLAVFSALAFGLAGFFMKASQMRGGALSSLLLGVYAAGTLGFWAQSLLTGSWQPFDWRVWTSGAVIGLGSAWGNLLFMRALHYGPASLTSPLANANIVIVMAAGIVWFDEPLRATALVGAAWLLAGIGLLSLGGKQRGGSSAADASADSGSAEKSDAESRSGSRLLAKIASRTAEKKAIDHRWYPLALAAMGLFVLRNGGLKVTDRMGLDSASVLWAGYLLSWLWFAAVSFRKERDGELSTAHDKGKIAHKSADARGGLAAARDKDELSHASAEARNVGGADGRSTYSPSAARRIGFRWGLAAGVFSYGGLQLYAEALARGPSHLVAPIFAANSLVVVVLSLLVYRERLTAPQYAALVCLLAGLVLIRV